MHLFFPSKWKICSVGYQGKRIWRILDLTGLLLSPSSLIIFPPPLQLTLLSHSCLVSSALQQIVGLGLGRLEPAGPGFQHPLIDWVCSPGNKRLLLLRARIRSCWYVRLTNTSQTNLELWNGEQEGASRPSSSQLTDAVCSFLLSPQHCVGLPRRYQGTF